MEFRHQLRGVDAGECGGFGHHQETVGGHQVKSFLPNSPQVPIAIRDSGAKGLGVFADSHIPQGTHVFTLTGQTTDYDTICQLVD